MNQTLQATRTLLLILILTITAAACTFSPSSQEPEPQPSQRQATNVDPPAPMEQEAEQNEEEIEPPPPEPPKVTEAYWIAAGDLMMHMPQYPGAYDKEKDRYNFSPFFEAVKPIVSDADWSMLNLETPIAGADLKYTGYPMFNAPPELAEAIRDGGFKIVTTANNHSLDRGERGVLRTIEALLQQELAVTGTASSEEMASKPVIIEKNEIKMGILAYTYGTNGVPIPQGKSYLVNVMDEDRMVQDIQELKQAGADFITIALHFGTEYQFQPNEEQQRIAHKLIEAGADIIAGSHPHVVQPYEIVKTKNKYGEDRRGIIIYSMGNFISNQRGDYKDYGLLFRLKVTKTHGENPQIAFSEIEPIPTWVHKFKASGQNKYRILPLKQTLEERSEPGLSPSDYAQLEQHHDILVKRINSMLD